MVEDEKSNLIIVEGNPDTGKYIIRRLKFTGDNNSGETESEESGFYIAFRNENDKDWTFSENKHYFDSTGDDNQNNLDALFTKESSDESYSHEVTGGTQEGSEFIEVTGKTQEGSEPYEATGETQEGSESYEAREITQEGSESVEVTGTTNESSESSEAKERTQEGSESYKVKGETQEGSEFVEVTGTTNEGSESSEATGTTQEGSESYEAKEGTQEGSEFVEVTGTTNEVSESYETTGETQEGSESIEVTERQEHGTLIDKSLTSYGFGFYKHPAGCHETCTLIMKWKEIPDTDFLEYHIEIGQQQEDFHIGFIKNHAFLVMFLICILKIVFTKSNASILGRVRCYNSHKQRICPRTTY